MTEKIILTSGDVLKMEFLEPLKISNYRLAKEIGVSSVLVGKIVNGKQGITADIAIRLSMFFKNTPQFWMNLQSICELNRAKEYFKNNPIAISSYINFIKKDKKKLA